MAGVPDVEFRVLGVLEVLHQGEPVSVGRGNALNLLAGLLISANKAVSAEALTELTWDGGRPARPRAALQNKVSRLRRIVGEETIETAVGGYRLRASASQLDLLRFGDLVGAAAKAAADEDARAALEEAIGLWHGRPLANVGSGVLQREVVPSLVDQYLSACEQWAAVCLRVDRADAVAERFGPLAVAHPFRETLAGQLMLALHRTGRRAGALAAYERLRVALRDELGVDPGPDVQDLHVRMLRDEVGRDGAGPDEASPAQPPWAGRGPAPGPLIGRDTDLKMLAEAVRSHHAVTVTGPAGVGKTELALQTARAAAGRFGGGVVVAELGTLPARRTDDLEAISAVLLAALSLPTPRPSPPGRRCCRDCGRANCCWCSTTPSTCPSPAASWWTRSSDPAPRCG